MSGGFESRTSREFGGIGYIDEERFRNIMQEKKEKKNMIAKKRQGREIGKSVAIVREGDTHTERLDGPEKVEAFIKNLNKGREIIKQVQEETAKRRERRLRINTKTRPDAGVIAGWVCSIFRLLVYSYDESSK